MVFLSCTQRQLDLRPPLPPFSGLKLGLHWTSVVAAVEVEEVVDEVVLIVVVVAGVTVTQCIISTQAEHSRRAVIL